VLGITSSLPEAVLRAAGAFAVTADFTAVPGDVRSALGLG
jgi:hypothetical protein